MLLKRKGWGVNTSTPHDFNLVDDAQGLDTALRSHLPEFNLPLSSKSSQPIIVGKWYSPFMFISEGTLLLKDQVSISMYYKVTLEQNWEQIFACENNENQGNVVFVDEFLPRKVILVGGREVVDVKVDNGVMWFKSYNNEGIAISAGLSLLVFERMKWEQERVGWVDEENDKQVNVKREEKFGGMGRWRKFGCYMLVERFVVKRMDHSLVLSYQFNHINQIRSKWE
uniref:Uncharacterized protein n=1 Tax=Fagus sylvatica TaxID=28930 RepID=A0A2N9IFV7_FAGSY